MSSIRSISFQELVSRDELFNPLSGKELVNLSPIQAVGSARPNHCQSAFSNLVDIDIFYDFALRRRLSNQTNSDKRSPSPDDFKKCFLNLIGKFFDNFLKQQRILQHGVFTEDEAAEYCGVLPETIRYHALRSRKLTYVKVCRSRLTFLKTDLDQFLKNARDEGYRDR